MVVTKNQATDQLIVQSTILNPIYRHHSAAITKCGRLYTWGHGKSGRLGHGNEHVCMLPTRVEGLTHQRVTDVATAESHTAALTSDGELYSWGRDRFGQVRNAIFAHICCGH